MARAVARTVAAMTGVWLAACAPAIPDADHFPCTTAQNACVGNTLSYCDTKTSRMASVACTDPYCQLYNFGSAIGCLKDDRGIFQCICNCSVKQNSCSGSTLTFCSSKTGLLAKSVCDDKSCADGGMGKSLGCDKASNGNYYCLCGCTDADAKCDGQTLTTCNATTGHTETTDCSSTTCSPGSPSCGADAKGKPACVCK